MVEGEKENYDFKLLVEKRSADQFDKYLHNSISALKELLNTSTLFEYHLTMIFLISSANL